MKTQNKLYEDLGSLMRNKQVIRNNPLQYPSAKFNSSVNPNMSSRFVSQNNLQGVELFNFTFHNWQKNVIRALHNKKNIYVVASPGAGKTAPVMYYWGDRILGINPGMKNPTNLQAKQVFRNIHKLMDTPEQIKKILYLCPIRQLVYSIQKEFREYLAQILIHAFNFVITTNISEVQILINLISNYNKTLKSLYRERRKLLDQYNRFSSLGDNHRSTMLQKQIEKLDDEIQNCVAKAIKLFIDDKLLRIKTATDPLPTSANPLIVVSIYESSGSIYDRMKKNIGVVIMDESHTIQRNEEDQNLNSDKISRADQITNHIYPIIKQTKKNNNQLILLSGTVHPTSARNLCNYIEFCLGVTINVLEVDDSRNASDISVLPMDNLNNEQTLLKLLTNPKENGNLIALFSKKKIIHLAKLATTQMSGNRYTSQQIDRGDLQAPKRNSLNIDLKDMDRYQSSTGPQARGSDPNSQVKFGKSMIDKINEMPSVGKIQNDDLLLKCLLSGFGYIFRQDNDSMSTAQKQIAGKNQKIVAELFSQGKIHTLMATDAIGVGLNMKIKNMYVPKATKFNGITDKDIPLSDASQFYNRVGRMAYQVSRIYTPEKYVDNIVRAVSATNRQYEQRETVINMNKDICRSRNVISSLWKSGMVVGGNVKKIGTSIGSNIKKSIS